MRPVDADAIYNEALENHQKGEIEDWEFDSIINYLDGAPTINTVEIVYCKDCKHRTEYGNCGHPRQKGVLPSAYPYDFCSYGDRRVDHLALEAETTQIIDGC